MSILNRFRLNDRTLLITGGSRGLGKQMALAIADAGADVVLVGRDPESLEATSEEIRSLGRIATPIQADVGDLNACSQMCEQVLKDHGPIDIVINNVGGRRIDVPLAEQSLEQWQTILDLNLNSTILCTREFGKAMIERGQGGRIINVASVSGMVVHRPIGGRSYETAKAAVIQFSRAAAVDWAPYGITVNAICPGGFMTEPNIRWREQNPEIIESFRRQIPMGEYGQPEDLGPLAVYLASDAARYMTGATLVIDGGFTLT